MTQKFKEFKLWEIADLFYGNKYDKNKMTHNNPKVNFVSRTAKNNGVTDVVDKTDQQPFEQGALTLAFGGSVGSCFLQTEPFYTGQNVGVIVIPNVSENAKLYVKTCLEKRCKQEFVAFSYEINRHFKTDLAVYLPIDESTGEPDWGYMDRYIQEIEDRYIQEIEDYFEVAGIDSIELTDDEKEILQKIPKFHEFRIGDLFEKVNLKRKTSKFDKRKDVSSNWTPEYSLPLVNAKLGDNGVMWWGKKEQWETATQTIDIVKNGVVSTGKVYPQPQETGVLWDAYLIKLIQPVTSSNILMYLSTAIEKAIRLRYTYGYKATWAKVQNDKIKLPIILGGEPDWVYMDKYLEASKKTVIAKYANSEERKIWLAKQILNETKTTSIN